MHGNLLTGLPASIGALSSLRALSAVGNQLTAVPDSLGSLQSLTSLELAGNRLETLPESIGHLGVASPCHSARNEYLEHDQGKIDLQAFPTHVEDEESFLWLPYM